MLRFNFVAGFAYVLAGFGLWRRAEWARTLSVGITLATAAVFVLFLWHVWSGGAYEAVSYTHLDVYKRQGHLRS